jgi:hypothetical protein
MTEVQAMQAALRAEYAVVYGYGVVGAHLTGANENYAMQRLTISMERRDRLAALVTATGDRPATARAAYALPFVVSGPAAAARLGAHLELGAANAAWDLTAAAPPRSSARALAVAWLSDAALSAAHWGGFQALPGQPV